MRNYVGFLISMLLITGIFVACETEPEQPVVTITATSLNIDYGSTVTINWSATNATSCSCDGGGGTGITGSFITPPLTKTTTFTVTATGPGGTVSNTITIQVGTPPKPTLKVTLDKDTVAKGQTVNMLIESTNVVSVLIKGVTSGGYTEKSFTALYGTFTTWPILETTNFTVTATGLDGSITIAQPPPVVIPTKLDTMTNYLGLAPWRTMKIESQEPDGSWIGFGMSDLEARQLWSFTKNGNSKVIDPLDGRLLLDCTWHFTEDLKHLFCGGRTDSINVLTDKKLVLSYWILVFDLPTNKWVNGPRGQTTYVH